MWCIGLLEALSCLVKNCPNFAQNEFLALKMYVFVQNCQIFQKNVKFSQSLFFKCQLFVQNWKTGKIPPILPNNAFFALKNVSFLSKNFKFFKNWPKYVKIFQNFALQMFFFVKRNGKLKIEGISQKLSKNEIFALEIGNFLSKNFKFFKILL